MIGELDDIKICGMASAVPTYEDDNSKFELYQEDDEIALENLKTDKLYIKGQEKTENKYTLKITYDETKNLKGNSEKVHIKVHSEQEKI